MRIKPDPHEPYAQLPRRRPSLRLTDFDYSSPGAYFITICTARKAFLLGNVVANGISLTAAGSMVASTWFQLAHHYPSVRTDAFVVMPNHIHGILVLTDGQPDGPSPENGQAWEPAPTLGLSDVLHRFKTLTTRRLVELDHPGEARPTYRHLWQRNYYEHVIRDGNSLQRIRDYIANNPLAWALDRENPSAGSVPSRANPEPWEV